LRHSYVLSLSDAVSVYTTGVPMQPAIGG
jgi:hypothetical protein